MKTRAVSALGCAAITIRPGTDFDVSAREALLDRVMGEVRFRRASERLREGQTHAFDWLAAVDGQIIGTVRLWPIEAGGLRNALLLGPLAVDPAYQGLGLGAHLVNVSIRAASEAGYSAIILVGDAGYYARFGFRADHTHALAMPGPYEQARLLGLNLQPGALTGAHGVLQKARVHADLTPDLGYVTVQAA